MTEDTPEEMRSKQELAVFLSKLRTFENPDERREQYPTDSEIAAGMLWDGYMAGDILGKNIADLGCGTGILGIGALMLGAQQVSFVDVDQRAIDILKVNLRTAEEVAQTSFSIEYFVMDIRTFVTPQDTVLQNPPFGTHNPGIDTIFLEQAIRIAPVVYTMHKTSTMEYIRKTVARMDRVVAREQRVAFPLKQTLHRHLKRLERIDVTWLKVA